MKKPAPLSKPVAAYLGLTLVAIVAVTAASWVMYHNRHKAAPQSAQEQALTAYKDKDYAKAQTILKQEAAQNPPDATTYNILANVSRDKGDTQQAIDYYKKAIEIDPKLVVAYTNLGDLYLNLGQPDQAAAIADAGLVAVPGNANLSTLKEEATSPQS